MPQLLDIYIMDWKIWTPSWKSHCQNFICCQCDFEKKVHCVQKGQSSPCKIEMIEFFLILFVSLSTPTGLLAQQAWFFLTPFWCHWGTKSRTNGLQQNSSTFNPFVCFSDRTISSFNFFVCFSDRTIIRGWRAGVGALYMVRWSTEGQANAAQVCFLIYNSYSSFKFWWGGIVRKMYDNLWEWDN